jgi:hypothetical protein
MLWRLQHLAPQIMYWTLYLWLWTITTIKRTMDVLQMWIHIIVLSCIHRTCFLANSAFLSTTLLQLTVIICRLLFGGIFSTLDDVDSVLCMILVLWQRNSWGGVFIGIHEDLISTENTSIRTECEIEWSKVKLKNNKDLLSVRGACFDFHIYPVNIRAVKISCYNDMLGFSIC